MADIIQQQIQTIKKQFEEVVSQTDSDIQKLQDQIELLVKASAFLEDTWVGQWATGSYNLYLHANGQENIHLTENDIWTYLKTNTQIIYEDIKNSIPSLTKKYRNLRESVITELSIIKSLAGYEKEVELLDSLENFKWGITSQDYIKQRRPERVVVYDFSVINHGLETPPHIVIGGNLISTFSILTSLEQFKDILKRLLKQIELKHKLSTQPTEETENKVSTFVIPIIERFHQSATQLRNRHDTRPTLMIADEYDVQDLLHCLLKINFEDVRPEEAVPSYAGKNSRVDFLLKREKTLIEVKKTRKGLKDKEVGDQLILDVAHYKSHSDCKRLICFVYDPETLISNPRGLEDDLGRLSTDEMLVEVYIRP